MLADHPISSKPLLEIEKNFTTEYWFELFISLHVGQSWNQLHVFALNWAEYLSRTFVWFIHLHVFIDYVINSKFLLKIEQIIWIGSLFELVIYCVFMNHLINFKSLLRIEQNIWIASCYGLFICSIFVDYLIRSKSFLRFAQNISI